MKNCPCFTKWTVKNLHIYSGTGFFLLPLSKKKVRLIIIKVKIPSYGMCASECIYGRKKLKRCTLKLQNFHPTVILFIFHFIFRVYSLLMTLIFEAVPGKINHVLELCLHFMNHGRMSLSTLLNP